MSSQTLLNTVKDQYGAVARSGLSNESAAVRSVAQAFGYTTDDLASLPPQANMPTTMRQASASTLSSRLPKNP